MAATSSASGVSRRRKYNDLHPGWRSVASVSAHDLSAQTYYTAIADPLPRNPHSKETTDHYALAGLGGPSVSASAQIRSMVPRPSRHVSSIKRDVETKLLP